MSVFIMHEKSEANKAIRVNARNIIYYQESEVVVPGADLFEYDACTRVYFGPNFFINVAETVDEIDAMFNTIADLIDC